MLKLNLQLHSAPGSLSALRPETFDRLQLNVGIFIKNFKSTAVSCTDAAALLTAIVAALSAGTNILGATRGGGQFTVGREMRDPEVDGLRYAYKGGKFVDSADPQLSTTLVEVTPDSFSSALGGTISKSGNITCVRMPTALGTDAYLTDLCWVGDLADGQLVMICLYNAVNTADFTFTFQDKGEGSFGVEFHGTQNNVLDYDYAPFEVDFFGKST